MSKSIVFSLFVLICIFAYSNASFQARFLQPKVNEVMHKAGHKASHTAQELTLKLCMKKAHKKRMEHTDHIQNNFNELYGFSTETPNLLAARAFNQLQKYDFKKNAPNEITIDYIQNKLGKIPSNRD